MVTFALSFLRKETALVPKKLVKALADGSIGALNAATTCACAGIVVGVVTLTGLGLKFSSIVISYAGGSLLLTAIYTSLIVWIIGLAVPVTASYIICAVIAAPALIKLGVPDYAAHMFIFYYAVLSEVSPPTALSPFAAAAICGGDPYKTTLQSWKYTLPAFLVPFVFVLDPQGVGLLLAIPKGGSWVDIVEITVKTTFGLVALAATAQNWALRQNTPIERGLLLLSGLLLVFPSLIEAIVEWIIGRDISYTYVPGLIIGLGVLLWQYRTPARQDRSQQLESGSDAMMTRMKKTAAVLAVTFSAGIALAGIVHAQQKTMSIGTGGTGGVYYPLGGAIANVLSKNLPNVQATAEVTGGSIDNLKLIGTGQSELGFTMADAALDAMQGNDKFKSMKVPLQTLLVVYPNRMHVVTVEGTGIETMADLKGKRVSTGSPGGATEVMAFRVIEAAGLDKDKDMKRERLGCGRIRQRHQGPQDRRVLLGRRHPDRGGDRSRGHAGHEDEADRPRRHGREDERQIRQALYRKHHQGRRLSRPGQGQRHRRGLEPDRHRRQDEQRRRLCHRQDAGGEEGRHRRRAQGSRKLLARQPGAGALADPVPSRRAEIFQGKGRRAVKRTPLSVVIARSTCDEAIQ